MHRAQSPPRKYEEYAYVLDFNSRGKSTTVRGRDGIIITSIGEDRLTLLEVLGVPNSSFEIEKSLKVAFSNIWDTIPFNWYSVKKTSCLRKKLNIDKKLI